MKRRRLVDPARRVAFDTLRAVHSRDAYANLALNEELAKRGLSARDAAFATELVSGTCRGQGSYDRIIEAASGRKLATLQPAVIDILRLGVHQILGMRVPNHAAVAASVDLAAATVGERVTGLVNAVLRKVSAANAQEWWRTIGAKLGEADRLAVTYQHPRWIVDAYAAIVPRDELTAALTANNEAPATTLVARPGLTSINEIDGGTPGRWSRYAVTAAGNPGDLEAVRLGRVGVQDEGSQLVTLAAVEAWEAHGRCRGPWLDLCAGPGGKAALLHGLALGYGTQLLASEVQPHRAQLVAQAVRAYDPPASVIVADGTRPAWRPASFGLVVADVPCSGLGALRRRPEARWRKLPGDVTDVQPLQVALLNSALNACAPGGVTAYVTCSPHTHETSDVVAAVVDQRADVGVLNASDYLPGVPNAARDSFIQLWPHRHTTDAMFCALLVKQ